MRRAHADQEQGKLSIRDTPAQGGGRARHDLRTDTGRVARRHRYPGTSHIPPFIVSNSLARLLEHEKSKNVIIIHLVLLTAFLRRRERVVSWIEAADGNGPSDNSLEKSRNQDKLAL